jgi:asparagine synthase (glutamine-hydrolysing)
MCGIIGAWSEAFVGRVRDANRVQAHRGPDGEGYYRDANVPLALGHVRLAILDLSSLGHQPMVSDDQRVVIVFNGEIYNFRELHHQLEVNGYRFRSRSDTEVLLALYLQYGEGMLSHLNGIFAFAIWDVRAKQLFLARDGFGVKPLYYADTEHGFVFGSEIKALLRLCELDGEIDPIAIHHYLTYLWCPAPRTPLRHVRKLEPGCAMSVKNGHINRVWRFYELPFHQPLQAFSESDAIEQVRKGLRTAVERQMVSDVEVGAFLSGGLDSSAVVAFAREVSPGRRFKCFTMEMSEEDTAGEGIANDLPYAESAARHLGVDLYKVKVGPEMADDLSKMIYHLDEPQADPAPLNVLFISRLAREHGIKVLLSGAGGDDIFTGYRRHRALMLERYWSWLPKPIRAGIAGFANSLPAHAPALRQFRKAFQNAQHDGDRRLAGYFHWLDPKVTEELLSREFSIAIGDEEPLLASLSDLSDEVPALNRMLYLECKHFLADHNLNYTDKMSMAAGVEVRVPLLDQDLVSLAARLPIHYKQRGVEGKWIFKKAMEGLLPQEVIYRPKTGFGVPLRSWLKGPLKEMIGDVLSTESLRRRGWFNPHTVERLLEADRAGRVDAAYPLFAVLCIELWGRMFLDPVSIHR